MRTIIQAMDLCKQYTLGLSKNLGENFRESLVRALRQPFANWSRKPPIHAKDKEHFWALRDVCFDLEEGEVLAIMGPNGAGKSTLLKILSRIVEPTSGTVRIRGRSSSLLEVGTGFHPELTGRENVFLNGVMLGMRKTEIASQFDEIVAFAGIEKFIDTPVKRYSSGMYVRLAFAVAAHLNPEILVVDEVLAVGDVAFQKKCLGKMTEVSQSGRTVLFVSHNVAAIENLCRTGLVLREGRVCFRGCVKDALRSYTESFLEERDENETHSFDLAIARTRRTPMRRPLLKRLELFSAGDRPVTGGIPIGGSLCLRVTFDLPDPTSNCELILGFDTLFGLRVLTASSMYDPTLPNDICAGEQVLTCEIPALTLLPGEYKVRVHLNINSEHADWVECGAYIAILPTDYYGTGKVPQYGSFAVAQKWRFG